MRGLETKVDNIVAEAIKQENLVGANVLVLHKGKELFRKSYGYADRENGVVMQDDTIFRLYSMSKPVLSIAAMIAMEKGLILINAGANIVRFVPPLIIEKEHVDEMIAILEDCIRG